MLLHTRHLHQLFSESVGDIAVYLQAHDRKGRTLSEPFLHVVSEVGLAVLEFFRVEADIRISRHGKHARLLLPEFAVKLRRALQQYVLYPYGSSGFAQHQDLRKVLRHLHECHRFSVVLIMHKRGNIKPLALEMRFRVSAVYDLRRQYRQHLRIEEFFGILSFERRQLFVLHIFYAFFFKLHADRPVNAPFTLH